ncbi:MAG: cellulase family glycosylhydrolase [Candidatus Hydrogenedentes bacterium]|nr:cellulase family glycosylhydrolase [Candidatus Hydrogenedentota bacterium]
MDFCIEDTRRKSVPKIEELIKDGVITLRVLVFFALLLPQEGSATTGGIQGTINSVAISAAASNLPVATDSSPDSPTPQIRRAWGPDVFWGVNVDMSLVTGSDLRELSEVWNVNTIRLSLRIREIQFIQDDNDPYHLNEADLWELDRYIDLCERLGLRVILTNHRPLGSREWFMPGGKDRRIWSDFLYHDYLVFFWQKLAERYANRGPVIAGYDIVNEPDPEDQVEGSPSDWNLLAGTITTAIRQADRAHTIIVESIWLAKPIAFDLLEPTGDDNTVYSFHFYSPYAFVSQGGQDPDGSTLPLNVTYPGHIGGEYWDKNRMLQELELVIAFQQRYNVPILCGEFSVARWAPSASAVEYLQDLLSICDEYNWSSLYWCFRDAEGSGSNLETEGGIDDYTVVGTNSARFQAIRPYFSRNNRWSGPMTGRPVYKPTIRFDEYHAELNTLSEQRAQEIDPSHPEWCWFGRFARRAEDCFDVVRSLQPLRYDTLRDTNVLILSAPQNALTAEEVTDTVRFVSEGGGLLVLGDCSLGDRLNSLMANFGMTYRQGILGSHTPLWNAPSFVVTNLNQTHFTTKGIHELHANWTGVLENLGDALVLAETEADSWLDANMNGIQDPDEQNGPYPFALAKQFGKGRVLAVADNAFYDAGILLSENRRFIRHALPWLAQMANSFSADPTSGTAPLTVQFTDESVLGALPIETWHWDFGDGGESDEPNPVHVYEAPGEYPVSLTVSTATGSDTWTRVNYIQVMVVMPVLGWTGLALVAALLCLCGVQIVRRRVKTVAQRTWGKERA